MNIIIDSSALVALFIPNDALHTRAVTIKTSLEKTYAAIILPSDVFSETLNILGKKFGHHTAIHFGKEVIQSPEYVIEDGNAQVREIAFKKFQVQKESVSFTDCIVMAVAQEYKTKLIFGFDEVFAKNDYTI